MGYLFADGDDDGEKAKTGIAGGVDNALKEIKEILKSNTSSSKIAEVVDEMDRTYSSLAKTMGLGRESAQAIKASLGDAYSDVRMLGGSMADIAGIQRGLVSALGTNVIATKEVFKDIYAAAKVSGQEADVLSKKFIDAGYNMHNIGEETKKIMDTARSLGVSAQAVTSAVLSNMEALDTHNFSGGVEGLARMASTSAGLRVDMGTILRAVDKAFNPEGAIEMAAAFQRLGVSQSELLDPMRLMNMSQNDPEAFQQSIAKMGASLTELDEKGNIRIAPGSIRKMKELADAAGIPQAEFAKMSKAAAEMDIKMSKIKFPDFINEDQKKLLANVTQMKDGEMKINVGGEMKDLNEALKSVGGDKVAFEKLIKDNTPKSNEELLNEQLTVQEKIANNTESLKGKTGRALAGTKKGEEMLVATGTFTKAITDSFNKEMDIGKMRKGLDENLTAVGDSLLKFSKGEGSFTEVAGVAGKILNESAHTFEKTIIAVTKNLNAEGIKIQETGSDSEKMVVNLATSGMGIAGNAFKESENLGIDSKVKAIDTKSTAAPINTDLKNYTGRYKDIVDYQKPENANAKGETFHSGNLNMDINVKIPSGMDQRAFDELMRTPEFREALLKMIHNAPQGNNKSNVPANG
jgi:hypothetical protein